MVVFGMNALLGGDDDAAHERVTGATQPGALELVAAGRRLERDGRDTASTLGQFESDVGADDVKAVHRVFTRQANLDLRAGLDSNL